MLIEYLPGQSSLSRVKLKPTTYTYFFEKGKKRKEAQFVN